jgi:capsular polysaccharide biosynthesis protein
MKRSIVLVLVVIIILSALAACYIFILKPKYEGGVALQKYRKGNDFVT